VQFFKRIIISTVIPLILHIVDFTDSRNFPLQDVMDRMQPITCKNHMIMIMELATILHGFVSYDCYCIMSIVVLLHDYER